MRASILVTLSLIICSPLATAASPPPNPWEKVKSVAQQSAEAIGGTTAGCLAGAEELPLSSPHHEVARARRSRYYGHPTLIRYVRELSADLHRAHRTRLVVGDLSQARGGPTMSKHISHQSGLDADIWFWMLPGKKVLSRAEREKIPAVSFVNGREREVNKNWRPYVGDMIRASAMRAEVSRVLVNPAIKLKLCREATGGRSWLAKVRPWWGHADHMHVRLACPSGSPDCVEQEPVPTGDDCGANLEWWWSAEALEEFKKMQARMESPTMPTLPDRCEEVLKAPNAHRLNDRAEISSLPGT